MQITSIGQAIIQRIARRSSNEERRMRRFAGDFHVIHPPLFINAIRRNAWEVTTIWLRRALVVVVAAVVVLAAALSVQLAQGAPSQDAPPQGAAPQGAPQATQTAPLTPEALQQLVAPIALYPDALVAQILAASTYPTQIVEANRWLQQHSDLQGDKLAKEVDKQDWDPSVKALTPFSSVLANLDTNLSWTSALGDAYYNQEQDVLDAVQVLRARA